MSGHSKWSKIKHKKAASDAQKSKVFGKLAHLIATESRSAKGDVNAPNLRTAIEKARAVNMPSDNILRAIKKGTDSSAVHMEHVVYEAYGPGDPRLSLKGSPTTETEPPGDSAPFINTRRFTCGTRSRELGI